MDSSDHPSNRGAVPAAPPIMQLKAAADYLHISPPHLASILAGKFPDLPRLRHVRVGRRILLRQDWLDQWMEEASLPPKS